MEEVKQNGNMEKVKQNGNAEECKANFNLYTIGNATH